MMPIRSTVTRFLAYRIFLKRIMPWSWDNQGSIAVETAVIMMVYLLIVFGSLDLLLIFTVSASLERASEVAAASYARSRDTSRAAAAAQEAMVNFGASCITGMDVVLWNNLGDADFRTGSGGYAGSGTAPPEARAARIALHCTWQFLTPVMANTVGNQISLTSWAITPLEAAP